MAAQHIKKYRIDLLVVPFGRIMPELAPHLTDDDLDIDTKVRLLMLYVALKNGSPESDINKIFECAEIPMRLGGRMILRRISRNIMAK